jgi:AraC-like DNA-binding protein
MPSSTVLTFTDPDSYTASLHGVTSQLTMLGRGHFAAKHVRVHLHRLSMRRLSDNLPRIAHSVDAAGLATIAFRTQAGPSLRRSGVEMLPSNMIRRGDAESYFQRSDGFACFGSISLPVEDMVSLGEAVAGCDLKPPRDAVIITPSALALGKFQRLHAAAGTLAEDASEIIAHPEAARGLEQALIHALLGCLGMEQADPDRSALRQHTLIMRRFHRAIEEHLDDAVYIPELCVELGVSERTLRVCCAEQLGVGPKRYLLLRRMRLARQALGLGVLDATTVTEIATRYGFWQFGRFAGEYKALFGESPSTTLARAPE